MQIRYLRVIPVFLGLSVLTILLFACQKPKQGKVIVSEQNFSIRHDHSDSWEVDAKGKVKNVGDVDVKNVVVTGYCKSCGEIFTNGAWFISNVDKTPDQKATIAYLPVGAEKEFSFKGVAFMMDQSGKGPDKMPKVMKCQVVSFETVQ